MNATAASRSVAFDRNRDFESLRPGGGFLLHAPCRPGNLRCPSVSTCHQAKEIESIEYEYWSRLSRNLTFGDACEIQIPTTRLQLPRNTPFISSAATSQPKRGTPW